MKGRVDPETPVSLMCSRHGIARCPHGDPMTDEQINIDEPANADPIEELRALVKEQQNVILAQNESIKRLESRVNDFDRKTTASAVKAPVPEPKVPEPDPQEVAYRAMLREMGIENKEPE